MVWAYQQSVDRSGAKFTLVTAAQYANENGVCWVGQDTLAEDMSMGVSTVRRHLDHLENDLELIERIERRRRDGTRTSDFIKLLGFSKDNRSDRAVEGESTAQIEHDNRSNRAGRNVSSYETSVVNNPLSDPNEEVSEKKKKRKVRALTLDETADAWDRISEAEPWGGYLKRMAQILAEANTTGTVAVTRCWRELGEPFSRYYREEPMSEEAWAYGFDAALRRGVANVGYARNAARNYTPEKAQSRKGENGTHQQQRTRSRKDEFRDIIKG